MSILLSTTFCSCSSDIKKITPGSDANKYSCEYKGRKRTFYLFTPAQTENAKLVVMLHGYGETSRSFLTGTQFHKHAVPKNYAVLYIDGIPNPKIKMSDTGWNYNYDTNGKDDINFITDLVLAIKNKYGLNKKSYAVGFSNGAFMVTKLATEKSKHFDACASVAGMMPESVWNHKKSKNHSVRFFQINGTADSVTPMKSNGTNVYNPNPAMEDVIEYFVKANRISSQPSTEELNNKVRLMKYEKKVWWMLIDKQTHSWPTERYCQLNINDAILDFFEQE